MQPTLGGKLRNKFPTRIPVVFVPTDGLEIQKTKFLVPGDANISQVMSILRKYVNVGKCEALFLMINNVLPPSTEILSVIYDKNKDMNDMLIINVTKENTFG